jgi:hypothetical protein
MVVMHDAENDVGEVRVSIALYFGSTFHGDDACAGFVGKESCYETSVAAVHDCHVVQSALLVKKAKE